MWFSALKQISRKRSVITIEHKYQIVYKLSIGTTFNDLETHLKVISAYVVIPTSSISEIIRPQKLKLLIRNHTTAFG